MADAVDTGLEAGTLVAGRYEVRAPLGAGAMGRVYLATDRDLERDIALKIHTSTTTTEQLRREALAMARLAHPNVVTVFEVGEHAGRTFVAMEYVAGGTLRSWLSARSRTRGEILAVLLAAGDGLVAAHEAQLVHRDVKPENILIGDDGRVRVSDFGLARESGPAPPSTTGTAGATGITGTPEYMAPEQARGGAVDARADQYSFCAVVWEALVGDWPRTNAATRNPRLRDVLERGLASDPDARYPDMRALLGAIRRSMRPRRRVLAVAAGLLAGAGAALALAWPTAPATDTSCAGAGFTILTFGLDVPARIAAAAPPATVDIVARKLAAYREAHIATARAICSRGAAGTWSADLVRRGEKCLDLYRRINGSAFDVASGTTPLDLIDLVSELTDDRRCGDAASMASSPAIPDGEDLVEIAAIRAELSIASPRRKEIREQALVRAERSRMASHPLVVPHVDMMRALLLSSSTRSPKDAEALFVKVYYSARASDDHEMVMTSLANLLLSIGVRQDRASLAEWIPIADADAQRAKDDAPISAGRLYLAIASIYDSYADSAQMLPWLDKALQLVEGRQTRALADVLMIRASGYISDGKPELARADYQRAIAVAKEVFGTDHPRLIEFVLNASAGLMDLGLLAEATALAREGEALLVRHPQPRTAALAQMLLNIGVAYAGNGDHERARLLLGQARALTLEVLGPDHPDLSLIDTDIVYTYVQEKNWKTADRLAREARRVVDHTLVRPHDTRGQLAMLQSDIARALGDHEGAITFAEMSAEEYSDGDDRKLLGYVVAATNANDRGQHARALRLLAKTDALPAPTSEELTARLAHERERTTGAAR